MTPAALEGSAPPPQAPPYDFASPLFGSYEDSEPVVEKSSPRKSRLPVLEIIVLLILVFGAGAAVWMMRSSVPKKSVAKVSNVDVTLSPANADVSAGHGVDLTATVTGSDNVDVTWSVQEGENAGRVISRGAKKAEGDRVDSLAVYIAPTSPGTYHVVATSQADADKSATAEINVKKGKSR
jgi:ABC-type Na+ efflux pump permease subunit